MISKMKLKMASNVKIIHTLPNPWGHDLKGIACNNNKFGT
jgi:hypothetical protein